MRVFLAIELPGDVRERIAELQQELAPRARSARWVRPENVHLTLRFLGEIERHRVDDLVKTLPDRLHGSAPFNFRIAGCGVFPDVKRPRTVWVGVAPVPQELVQLQEATELGVQASGLAPERRPFVPHLTIARVKRPDRSLGRLVEAVSDRELGKVSVSELVLFESKLLPEGARYEVVERFPLAADAPDAR